MRSGAAPSGAAPSGAAPSGAAPSGAAPGRTHLAAPCPILLAHPLCPSSVLVAHSAADGETAPESPSKKLCAEPEAQKQDAAVAVAAAATPGPSSEAAAAAAAAGKGRAAAAVPDMASAVKPAVRPPREELPAPAAAAAAAAAARASRAPLQQRQLTSMPEFSRRTKVRVGMSGGEAGRYGG